MSGLTEYVKKNNRVTAPLLAIAFSMVVVLLGIYVYGTVLYFVPIVTFVVFHYTGLYRLKLRLLGGTLVFFVVAFLIMGIFTVSTYNSQPTFHTQFYSGTNGTGSNVTVSITPYSGVGGNYEFNMFIVPNGTLNYSTLNLNVLGPGNTLHTVDYGRMNSSIYPNGSAEFSYRFTNLPYGLYSFNLSIQNNGALYTPSIGGPININIYQLYFDLLPSYYTLTYIIVFELLFIAGIFIARSISHSRSYQAPPKQQ